MAGWLYPPNPPKGGLCFAFPFLLFGLKYFDSNNLPKSKKNYFFSCCYGA